MATARDVARRAGVSTSTVSHVFNGTRGVSKKLRDRVLAASDELGFEPNIVARTLKTNQSRTLGFVVPDVNAFYIDVLRGVEDVAGAAGYAVMFCHTHDDPTQEQNYLRLLRARRADGIILSPAGTYHDELDRLSRSAYPLVLFDCSVPGLSADLVAVDNEPAAHMAVAHLIEKGHRRIGMVSGDYVFSSSERRVRGYRRALEEAGIPFDESLVVSGASRADLSRRAVLELMSRSPRPTALFVGNNQMTAGAMIALQELGLAVPDDVAYVGFDDVDWASFLRPQMTMVAQPTYEIGRTATQMVIDRIEGDPDRPARRVSLEAKLMVRESSGGGVSLAPASLAQTQDRTSSRRLPSERVVLAEAARRPRVRAAGPVRARQQPM